MQATVSVTGTETIKTYSVTWGPGIVVSEPTGSVSNTYANAGLYALAATATTPAGVVHTGLAQLAALKVNPSSSTVTLGYYPTLSTTLTNTTGGAYPWIGAGGTISVNGSYARPPSNPTFSAKAPTLTATAGATQTKTSGGSNYVSGTYSFAAAGYYGITMVVGVTNGTATLYQNFTWGIFVGTTATGLGCALCKVPVQASPHPGTVYNYEVIPGGALDLDPAADYYSVGYEVGEAFDESLISFNGTDSGQTPANFVPEVATCVPGSALCTKLYGSTLVTAGPGGLGQNYTFVIDKAAHFYDPSTGKSRGVYPSDVMFSIIRAIFYTQIVGATGYYVGFDIAGPLTPYIGLEPTLVSNTWDVGPGGAAIHAPYNNTPYYTLGAFGVNDSNCPAVAMSQDNGCITFHASADGKSWPALEQILSIISADGIQEAGWYTAQGADVPGFVCHSNVDLPCQLPGDVSTTTAAAYQTWVANSLTGTSGADSPYGWDAEELADLGYPTPVLSVAFAAVGSGPYYLDYANPGVGYVLKQNPAYQAPTGCAGQIGCLPSPGQFVPNVIDYWEPSDTVGISEIEAGYADTAGFESPDFPTMLSLVANGQIGLINFPTLDTDNYGFNTQIDLALLATIDSSPPHPINIQANALAYVGLRSVLEYAYPYATAQALGNVIDGIDGGNPFGGFLPPTESTFYNAQTPWPNYDVATQTFTNPSSASASTPGSPAWYWAQATTSGTPYYDPQLASYSSSNPLYIPVVGFTSAPNINAVEVAWGHSVAAITGNVVQFQQFFVPSTSEIYTYTSPGLVPWAVWWFGWIPDYPAPVNNWEGAYGTGLWGAADAIYQTFGGDYGWGASMNLTTCGHYGPTLANLTYWADAANAIIPQGCQGPAFNVTAAEVINATYNPNPAVAVQLWDLIQDVYNNLQLSIGNEQSNVVFTYAPWINPSSINQNVLIGGGAEWYYQGLSGNGIV